MTPNRLAALSLLLCASHAFAGNAGRARGVEIYVGGAAASAAQGTRAGSGPRQSNAKIYKYRVGGVTTFSDIAPLKGAYGIVNVSCFACNPVSSVNWRATKLYHDAFSEAIDAATQKYGVDPALVRAVIHAESGFNARARSRKGAIGLMQLMPATAREVGVTDPHIPEQNIRGGVRYLAGLLAKFRHNVTLATAAYNAGPGAVDKYGGIPPYAETQAYVSRVNILHERYKSRRPD